MFLSIYFSLYYLFVSNIYLIKDLFYKYNRVQDYIESQILYSYMYQADIVFKNLACVSGILLILEIYYSVLDYHDNFILDILSSIITLGGYIILNVIFKKLYPQKVYTLLNNENIFRTAFSILFIEHNVFINIVILPLLCSIVLLSRSIYSTKYSILIIFYYSLLTFSNHISTEVIKNRINKELSKIEIYLLDNLDKISKLNYSIHSLGLINNNIIDTDNDNDSTIIVNKVVNTPTFETDNSENLIKNISDAIDNYEMVNDTNIKTLNHSRDENNNDTDSTDILPDFSKEDSKIENTIAFEKNLSKMIEEKVSKSKLLEVKNLVLNEINKKMV